MKLSILFILLFSFLYIRAQEKVTDAFEDLKRVGVINESESVMRIKADEQELKKLEKNTPSCGYFCFPEDRLMDVRSTDFFPKRWLGMSEKQQHNFTGKVRPGEFYTFQLALYPVKMSLKNVRIVFGKLENKGGQKISRENMRCFNTGGTDKDGRLLVRRVDVPERKVQSLWIGVEVPADAKGIYEGTLLVVPDDADAYGVNLTLDVDGMPVENHGDNEGWRHSRLRWLDSRIGSDARPTLPYVPVSVKGRELNHLGGTIVLGESGLPERVTTHYNACNLLDSSVSNEVLKSEMKFVVETEAGIETLKPSRLKVKKISETQIEWTAEQTGTQVNVLCRGRMEFDGFAEISLQLVGRKDVNIKDIRLEIPYTSYASRYFMGLGEKGGFRRPGEISWKWDTLKHQDEFWIGNVNAGLKIKLKDENYHRPLVNIYYALGRLRMPASWGNGGQGGIRIVPGSTQVEAIAYSGERKIRKGESLYYDLELLMTPVKPLDMENQVKDRFYHSNSDVSDTYLSSAQKRGANLINIHHKKDIYPFINYPYSDESVGDLKEFVKKAHDNGIGVRTYYTTRELTVKIPEIWALRSLGNEVIMDGPGKDTRTRIHKNGPNAWLNENMTTHFIPAWYNAFNAGKYKGNMDISVITTPDSRWNNYYLEGLDWMIKNIAIDGIYIDDSALDRVTLQRGRRILDADGRHRTIDMHSWNHMNESAGYANSLLIYADLFPYADRLWIGEGFKYANTPDFWLVEMSGIPFGLMSETLDARNYWRGMMFGMTPRLPWSGDPTPLWKMYDDFGMGSAVLYGFWNDQLPVRSDNPSVPVSVFVKEGKAMVVIANWTEEAQSCRLVVDERALGFKPSRVTLPAMSEIQAQGALNLENIIEVEAKKGWFILLEK